MTFMQHSMKGRSTVTQSTHFSHEWGSIIDAKGQVDVPYFDFYEAFDSVY